MSAAHAAVLVLYSVAIFLGAGLLFVVQPMVGKMVLPLLGGTPAVWSTCMVFFQASLLVGYAYAHASMAWLDARRQAVLHLLILAVPLAVLPLDVSARWFRGTDNPVLDVLLLLSATVALPFIVVSSTAPLLQTWFARTGHPAAGDPYFLYAASNLGSMLALLSYPFLLEPRLHLRAAEWSSQTRLWTLGYGALALLILACAVVLWTGGRRAEAGAAGLDEAHELAPTAFDRVRWIALSFVPSSLLLGVTTYITTDLAPVPLLWVLPLALYLLTFILAFGRWPSRVHRLVKAATLPVGLLVIFFMVSEILPRLWMTALWHLTLLLAIALACHGELALRRPQPRYLTGFYLLLAVGGVLGGLFNALLAPLVFTSLAEYPLAIVLGCMLVVPRPAEPRGGRLFALALAVGVVTLAFVLYSSSLTVRIDFSFLVSALGLASTKIGAWLDALQSSVNKELVYGPPIVVAYLLRRRPLALGLAMIGILAVAGYVDARKHDQIRQTRSYFGILKVSRGEGGNAYVELRHGTTIHGRQSVDPARRGEPLSYYHRKSPIGLLFGELARRDGGLRTALIGLGAGTLAAYARTGDAMTIYEIDGQVRDIAFDRTYFTYVDDARMRGASIRLELGDARVRLEAVRRERPGERYDLIVVDAFTSDAIPVHLLTREALSLYLDRLKPEGIVALHISNRHLRLQPVVANLAEDAQLGGRIVMEDTSSEGVEGAITSTWALLARTPDAFGDLVADAPHVATLAPERAVGVWTDDFHSLLRVFRW